MSDLLDNNPQLFQIFFLIFFLGVWVVFCLLISRLGGWSSLAESYADRGRFSGAKKYFQSFSMGSVCYGSCATVGVNNSHLYLSIMWIFRLGSPNLVIPYSDIAGREVKLFFFRRVHLTFSKVPGVTLKLGRRRANRIEKATDGAWSYNRL